MSVPDEETPLLGRDSVSAVTYGSEVVTAVDPTNQGDHTQDVKSKAGPDPEQTKRTLLPWAQFSIISFLQLVEPLTGQVIYPFAPELIRSLNIARSDAEVGYYVGIVESLFFATQACTVLHWSRLSDIVGRKPVVLTGLLGLWLSMYCIGLSKTFWGLVFSRALNGALNGNIGVIKTMFVEITDHTNMALAYSYQPIAWSTGVTLGPIIGGALSRPAERFPNLFGNNEFLREYPYFLPCAVTASFSIVAWFVAFFYLKETHPSPKPIREFVCGEKKRVSSEEDPVLTQPRNELEKPVPLRDLLTRDVLIASASYCFVALVDMSFRALQPIFLSTPVELGGLGLDPPMIGTIMSFFGILNGVLTVFFFSRMTDYFGVKGVYLIGMTAAVSCFSLFPLISHLARNSIQRSGDLGTVVWITVGIQVVLSVLVCLCYGAVFIFIAAAAPNRASLGTTNGLAQVSVSVVRAVGPALVSSVYSLSIDKEHHYMNGGLVYYVTVALSFGAIWVGCLLPERPFK